MPGRFLAKVKIFSEKLSLVSRTWPIRASKRPFNSWSFCLRRGQKRPPPVMFGRDAEKKKVLAMAHYVQYLRCYVLSHNNSTRSSALPPFFTSSHG